jgi:hypothetical protein
VFRNGMIFKSKLLTNRIKVKRDDIIFWEVMIFKNEPLIEKSVIIFKDVIIFKKSVVKRCKMFFRSVVMFKNEPLIERVGIMFKEKKPLIRVGAMFFENRLLTNRIKVKRSDITFWAIVIFKDEPLIEKSVKVFKSVLLSFPPPAAVKIGLLSLLFI